TNWPLISSGLRRDHFDPARRRSQTKRRRAQVENDLCPLLHERAQGFDVVKRSRQIFVCPDVLANGHTDFLPVHLKWLYARGRLEITVLIKNVVRRQKRLVRLSDRFAALE